MYQHWWREKIVEWLLSIVQVFAALLFVKFVTLILRWIIGNVYIIWSEWERIFQHCFMAISFYPKFSSTLQGINYLMKKHQDTHLCSLSLCLSTSHSHLGFFLSSSSSAYPSDRNTALLKWAVDFQKGVIIFVPFRFV